MSKKPVAVVITDTHMTDKNIPLVRSIFDQTFEYCKQNKIKYIFHGGDWFTSRTGQSRSCLLETKKILEKMHREYHLEMWAIAGNHDKDDQSIKESFLTVFEDRPGFRLVSLQGGIPFGGEGLFFHFIPYFTTEKYLEILNESSLDLENGKNILITHCTVNGAVNNDGSKAESGISTKLFEKFHSVFIGHYHNKNKVGKNIYYIGSAYQSNFGEDTEKGITVIYDDGSHEQVRLEFPLFVKFKIDAKNLDAKTIKDLELIKKEHPDRNVRIILTGTEEEVNSFNKSILEDIGLSVDKRPNDIEIFADEEEIETVSYNKENLKDAFGDFCEHKKITDNKYGIEKLNQL